MRFRDPPHPPTHDKIDPDGNSLYTNIICTIYVFMYYMIITLWTVNSSVGLTSDENENDGEAA